MFAADDVEIRVPTLLRPARPPKCMTMPGLMNFLASAGLPVGRNSLVKSAS